MKKIVIIVLLLMFLAACQTTTQTEVETKVARISFLEAENLNSEYLFWHGRHHYQEEKEYFYYPATGFKFSFTGRVVDIKMSLADKNSDVYFSIAKNGEDLLEGEVFVLSQSEQVFRITFDTYDTHTVEIVKRSEPRDGITALVSIETNGYFNKWTDENQAPHFLLIGASGISGNGAIGTFGQPRTTTNSSALHAFGYLTARNFSGTYEFVSNSGWGLAFGYNDQSGTNNIQGAYESVGIDSNQQIFDIPWSFVKTPDVIIVNIGGNDYSAVINNLTGFAKEQKIQEFKQAVAQFLLKLRNDAPEAHIFWTMTEGSLNGIAAQSVINLLDPQDKIFVHVVVIKSVGEDGDPIGANNHASYITHQKSAAIITEAIEKYTTLQSN